MQWSDLPSVEALLLLLRSEFPDESVPARFIAAVDRGLDILTFAPHTCRRCEAAPRWRELIVPFGQTGFVVLFEISGDEVLLLGMRSTNHVLEQRPVT